MTSPDILVAAYGRRFRLAWSVMFGMATAVVVGAAVADESTASSPEPMFMIAAVIFFLLAGGLLLTIWRSRISFKDDGMLISRPWSTIWKTYDDLIGVGRTADRVDLRFGDGSKVSINRHMANISLVYSLLTAKAPGR
jgi:hypothetical protein